MAILTSLDCLQQVTHTNPKWIARGLKSAPNRVPIRETYFELSERHNPNMSILLPETSFAEMISLLAPVVGEDTEYVLNPLPVALPKERIYRVFWVLSLEIALVLTM